MQNQRQNGRPNAAVRMAGLFLVLFCVAAVLIPAKTLFTGNGFFADYIHFTESFCEQHSIYARLKSRAPHPAAYLHTRHNRPPGSFRPLL